MGPKLSGTFGPVTRSTVQLSRGVILGAFLWGLLPQKQLHCQSAIDHRAQWSASIGAGFLVPHRSVIRGLIDGHARRVALSWSSPALGYWASYRNHPQWGLSLIATEVGASEHIGTQVAALSHVDLTLHGRWSLRLGGGLGWTQKTWDSASSQGREQVVIGSAINGAAQLGMGISPNPQATGWHRNLGFQVRLDHQSNASYKQPNLGTNVVSIGISASLLRATVPRRSKDSIRVVAAVLPAPTKGSYMFLGVGRRQPAPLENQENVLECGYEYRFGGRSRVGYVTGGLLMFRPQHWGSSLHAGFQLRFTRVHIDLLHGRYLTRWQSEENLYNRVVLNVHLHKGWWSRLVLHTHGFRAHHPALGIAWIPGNPSPLYPLK